MTSSSLRVWLVDDDASIRWVLERALRAGGRPGSFRLPAGRYEPVACYHDRLNRPSGFLRPYARKRLMS